MMTAVACGRAHTILTVLFYVMMVAFVKAGLVYSSRSSTARRPSTLSADPQPCNTDSSTGDEGAVSAYAHYARGLGRAHTEPKGGVSVASWG